MKKLILILAVATSLVACKKSKTTPIESTPPVETTPIITTPTVVATYSVIIETSEVPTKVTLNSVLFNNNTKTFNVKAGDELMVQISNAQVIGPNGPLPKYIKLTKNDTVLAIAQPKLLYTF